MRCSFFKYDVAISVAVEDKAIAQKISIELGKRKIHYYYYEEMTAESWGEYIIDLTSDAYGRRSLVVLMITSKHYAEKYWSGIERQIAMASPAALERRILQLKLDSTVIDGYSKHIVAVKWQNDPVAFAELLRNKLKIVKRKSRRKCLLSIIKSSLVISAIAITYFYARPKPRGTIHPTEVVKSGPVMITGYSSFKQSPSPQTIGNFGRLADTFFICNTEVTVGQYREYCLKEGLQEPLQPEGSYEHTPVVNVSWNDALAYCKWVNGRLPSKKEWEYAASGGLNSKYSGSRNASRVAVYGVLAPKYVGSKKPNAFGTYDMTGNVAEWCSDDGLEKHSKVVKGGAYNSLINPVNELSIYHTISMPDTAKRNNIGFRVAWDQKPSN